MSDDTPTERFTAPTAPTPVAADDEPRSRTLLYVLIGVGAALVVAIIILLIVLATRGTTTPEAKDTPAPSASPTPTLTSPSPTPTPTPSVSETEEAAPPPPPPAPSGPIESFTVDETSVDCDGNSSVTVHFAWKADGIGLWFGVGVNDAEAAPYAQYELEDELDFDYQCGQSSGQQKYTITVKSSGGVKTSQSIIITE